MTRRQLFPFLKGSQGTGVHQRSTDRAQQKRDYLRKQDIFRDLSAEELDVALGSLYVYLPALSAWAALVTLVLPIGRIAPPVVRCYLLCGVLAQLALHPRADTVHALLAGAPLFVCGAWTLAQAHRTLGSSLGRLGRALLFGALLLYAFLCTAVVTFWPGARGRYVLPAALAIASAAEANTLLSRW